MSDPIPPSPSGAPSPQVPSPSPQNQPAPPAPPAGYAAPAVGQPAGPAGAQGSKNNVLALVAMIVGAVGFIFACIPGALILGWVLLPIAFILGIVSLFLKGDRKWMGIVAIILSVVGTIVGAFVFFAVMASAVDEAFGDTDTTVSQPAEGSEDADDESADESEGSTADADQGTRDNPYPLKSEISSSDWTVVVNSYNADGNDTVAAGDFNDPAPAGSHYEIINYTVTYNGDESGLAAEVGVDVVTSAGNVINSYDNLVILDDGFGLDEMYKDGSATGSVAFLVPDDETVVIRVRPGIIADEVFVQP